MSMLIKLKIMGARLASYVPIIQFPMVAYLFIKQLNWNVNASIIGFGLLTAILGIVDYKLIFSREQTMITEKNPVIMEMMGDLKAIKRKLEMIE